MKSSGEQNSSESTAPMPIQGRNQLVDIFARSLMQRDIFQCSSHPSMRSAISREVTFYKYFGNPENRKANQRGLSNPCHFWKFI